MLTSDTPTPAGVQLEEHRIGFLSLLTQYDRRQICALHILGNVHSAQAQQ